MTGATTISVSGKLRELGFDLQENMAMRTRRPKPPPNQYPIEIEIDGKTYRGSYAIEDGTITVHSPDGSKTTHESGNNDVLARIMLGEIFRQRRED
jgi:hypothetical protein